VSAVDTVTHEFGNKELVRRFAMTEKALRDGGFITERCLADLLDDPVMSFRRRQDGFKHRPRVPVDSRSQPHANKTVYRRPGLLD